MAVNIHSNSRADCFVAAWRRHSLKLFKSLLGEGDEHDCYKTKRSNASLVLIKNFIEYCAKSFGLEIDGLGSGGGCPANPNGGKGNGGKIYYIFTYKVDLNGVYNYNVSVEDGNIVCMISSKQMLKDEQLQAMADECAATGKITSTSAR